MWLWIGIGLGAFFGLSILIGVALAAMLGTISRGVAELHEAEAWAVQPPTPGRSRRVRLRHRQVDELAAHSLLQPHP